MTELQDMHLDEQALFLYLDRELEPTAEASARRHLASCRRCQSELESLQRLYTRLGSLEDLQMGRDLSPAILAGIRQARKPAAPALWVLATQLLVVVAVLGVSWSYIGRLAASSFWGLASVQTATTLTTGAARLAQQWAALQAEITELLAWIQRIVELAASSQAPPLSGWPWLVAATLVWVLGNGFLLQGGASPQRNRDPGP